MTHRMTIQELGADYVSNSDGFCSINSPKDRSHGVIHVMAWTTSCLGCGAEWSANIPIPATAEFVPDS